MVLHGAKQVHVGSQLPNVQLVLPSAADPEPESFVMTQDLFNGTCCSRGPHHPYLHACLSNSAGRDAILLLLLLLCIKLRIITSSHSD